MNYKDYYSFLIRTYSPEFPAHLEFKNWRMLPTLAFDCETTGLYPDEDPDWNNPAEVETFHLKCESVKVVQLSMMLVTDRPFRDQPPTIIDSVNLFINPGIPIPPETTHFHQITDEMVKDAPSFIDIIPVIEDFVSRAEIAFAFNGRADYNFLNLEFARIGHPFLNLPVIDPLPFERDFTKMREKSYKLFDVAKRYAVAKSGQVHHGQASHHQADVDVEMLYEVMYQMGLDTAKIPWDLGDTIIKQARLSVEHEEYFAERRRKRAVKASKAAK